ncbi:MAG: hypothetical protein P8X49_10875 [Syntrophobacterales bacterium]|jgi:hypothetical protein
MRKLQGYLNTYNFKIERQQVFEEYREDDESVYFEEGFIER